MTFEFQDGESWDPDPCSSCSCEAGEVTCYRQACPACPEGTVRVDHGNGGREGALCCERCEKVQCANECSSCLPRNPTQCTWCREAGKLVQSGRCVDRCRNGFFPGGDNTCHACHESCHTCFDKSEHHCLTCPPLYLIKDGKCVKQCGQGYFRREAKCLSCHSQCSACTGPHPDQCLACTIKGQVLKGKRCVDGCGPKSFLQGQECQNCPQTCQSCVPDGPECSSCRSEMFLFRGQCLSTCPRGMYPDGQALCQGNIDDSYSAASLEFLVFSRQNLYVSWPVFAPFHIIFNIFSKFCHPSCSDCKGPGLSDCTACHYGLQTLNGKCNEEHGQCGAGQYVTRDLECVDCAPGCAICYPSQDGLGSLCSQCVEEMFVLSGTSCRKTCRSGTFLRDTVCLCKSLKSHRFKITCDEKCEVCSGPAQCTKCHQPFLLSDGHCTMACGPKTFTTNDGVCQSCSANCLECSDHSSCTSCDSQTFLKDGVCVTSCGENSVTRLRERMCEDNSYPPKLEVLAELTVKEGGMADLSNEIVHVTDQDTGQNYLSLKIESITPLGQVIKVDIMGNTLLNEGDTIRLEDVMYNKVRFLHGMGRGFRGVIAFKAFDGQLYSEEKEVSVNVLPKEVLELAANRPLLAVTGQDTELTSDVLNVNIPNQQVGVAFILLNGPSHGKMVFKDTRKLVRKFTVDDLTEGRIVYSHSGNSSEMLDMIRLEVTNGLRHLSAVLPIKIQSKTGSMPVILSNTGGHVFQGDVMQISRDVLEAKIMSSDLFKSQADAVFTLVPTTDNPRNGEVMMVVPIPQDGPSSGWTDMGSGMMGARMFRFLQRDINEGRIYYKHNGDGFLSDSFTFEVADTASPPNILRDQMFHVTVMKDETEEFSLPTLAPGVRLGMTVLENQIVPVTTKYLSFNDVDTPPEDLVYRITTLLHEEEGTIEHIDFPFSPVLQFTQDDVNNNRIIYRPPDEEIGMDEMEVNFLFVVTDGGEDRELSEHKFTIRVVPVNNNPPLFANPNPDVTISEGGIFPLTSGLLEVIDPDTALNKLQVTVVEAPTSGLVEKMQGGLRAVVRSGDTFSYSDVLQSTFQYVHTGSIDPPRDKLSLTVSDGVHETGNTVYFTIIKVDKSAPMMLPSASCQVNVTEGNIYIPILNVPCTGSPMWRRQTESSSVEITRSELAFSDEDDEDNAVEIVLAAKTTHGHFEVAEASGQRKVQVGDHFTQEDVNEGRNIFFFFSSFHAEQEIGPRALTELVYVNVTDASGNLLPSQILSVLITPVDNLAPVVVVGPLLKVEEGGESAIGADLISVLDVDSPIGQLMFIVETDPSFGKVENRKPAKGSEKKTPKSAKSFPLTDLIDGHIHYTQSDHKNKEPAWDAFLFSVTDGKNESPLQRFNISIKLLNDEAPQIITEQLFAREGRGVTLTNASMYVVDLDSQPQDLMFTLTTSPANGQLMKKEYFLDPPEEAGVLQEKSTFTYEDVLNELVFYKHDDGETTQDSVTLHLSDGDFSDEKTLQIVVGLVNDETPRMTINRGLRVQAVSSTVIKNRDLRATDLDSEDSEIMYTIMKDPTSGRLQFDNGDVSYILTTSTAARTFKQRDIDAGHISYIHTVEDLTGNIIFKFKLTDTDGNELIDQDFFITVFEDRLYPIEVNNKEFLVEEGGTAKLTTDVLSFTDADTEPGSLTYAVLEGPDLGHLELVGQPGVPIVTFTQSDLAANTVTYVHTSDLELYADRFNFAVSDGSNEVVQTFFINVRPVDDAIPVLSNQGLRVQEGVRKLVTEFELKAVDQDTKEDQIQFTVVEPPIHGTIELLTNETYSPAVTFSMADIYENRVSYQHDGSETVSDSFSFIVSDGTNKVFAMQQDQPAYRPVSTPQVRLILFGTRQLFVFKNIERTYSTQLIVTHAVLNYLLLDYHVFCCSQEFAITILPMDDGMPIIQSNLGLQYLEFKGSDIGNIIRSQDLSSADEDTSASEIVYAIKEAPKFGVIEHIEKPGLPIASFTQEDINQGVIRYKLVKESKDLQDSFGFDVMDGKPNIVPDNRFHITWSEISFGNPTFNVSETQGIVQIPVLRRGNLKQYSIVKCRTIPGSAVSKPDAVRPGLQDFVPASGQVQFDEWQESKPCSIFINDDTLYEGPETFYVELFSPTFTVLGKVKKVAVSIYDSEDEPLLQFQSGVLQVNETDKYAMATIVRSGNVLYLSETVSVICFTRSLTATGSSLTGLESGSDYVSRGQTNAYRVVFPPGVTQATCDVKLIDDSQFESMEQFELELSDPSMPAAVGPMEKTLVIIAGPNDVSLIYLSEDMFTFPEDSGTIGIEVLREGSDLSHTSVVWCATRLSDLPSATPGEDYVPSSAQITFGPEQNSQMCHLILLDDDFDPKLEGNETFVVFLSSAVGSVLDQPFSATVTIYDDGLDIPQMTFSQDSYIIDEKNKTLNATINRLGDVNMESSIICFTRQQTAQVMMDFDERIFTNASLVTFRPGERSKSCIVNIVDDEDFEPDEVFLLKLGLPEGSQKDQVMLGAIDTATVTITNHDDVPRVQFEHAAYSVHEPSVSDQITTIEVKIIRTGAANDSASVRCSTRDGSAQSGSDYNAKSLVLYFKPGEKEKKFLVDVLYNSAIEWHESFSLQLGPEEPNNSVFGSITVATITILDNEVSGSLVLPSPPVVVSLLHLDDVEKGVKVNPSPGYPLVCLTPCDVHYPTYATTSSLCQQSGINETAMLYQWEVAMPPTDDGVSPLFVKVTDKTLFTSVDKWVLDSIYFRPFFQIRCIAQPLHGNGNPGIPLKSQPITIGHTNPVCRSPSFAASESFSYQAQSFLATLDYIKPDSAEHPNTVHISVQIPHQDGMLPLISTHPLHNLRFLLSEPVYRQQHLCSNIITAMERAPLLDQAFLGDKVVKDDDGETVHVEEDLPFGPGFDFPYQFDSDVREQKSLVLYRHLNLKNCIWQFDAWYHMTELVDMCGGRIVSDFQVKDQSDTHLTVRVPLHVSYIYATAPTGWGSLEHRTEMEFSFYYNTVLWRAGLETEGRQNGRLQVVRILIGDDGKLVIEFRSQAKFRGLFVAKHHTLPGVESRVVAPESLSITFDLELVWSQNTFDSPHQVWQAKSRFNLKDYTGVYSVELVPCIVSATQGFVQADPLPCAAQQPQKFDVPISFQQTNRPVPVTYSLNTDFQLSNNLKMFLLDPTTEGMGKEDWEFNGAFSKGQKLYGRVLWNHEQDLKTAYRLVLEKVYLCTGRDGYIPTYDPSGDTYGEGAQFGCIQPSKNLLHRFLILDRENPDVITSDFHQVPFQAQFASENQEFSPLSNLPGVDGFIMDIDPLYKVDSGHQWYLQVIYTISPADLPKHKMKRSISAMYRSSHSPLVSVVKKSSSIKHQKLMKRRHALTTRSKAKISSHKSRRKRDAKAAAFHSNQKGSSPSSAPVSSGELRNGTNMRLLHLVFDKSSGANSSHQFPIAAICAPVILVLLSSIIIIVLCVRKRRRRKEVLAKSKTLVTINNQLQRGCLARTIRNSEGVSFSPPKSDNRNNAASVSRCNIIKPKNVNKLAKQGINVDSGTEV
ncbi:extracellular matrix protein FRAS1 [Aplysia californica]|uniref:Extracellular matrix protein FRAS1 n=1 Tax=Aplysia californica TaxID=6500 RepID=A0ABM1VVF7_APLCA|nr:extracellular matrix protein FRAS1 [Aplysia californica]